MSPAIVIPNYKNYAFKQTQRTKINLELKEETSVASLRK